MQIFILKNQQFFQKMEYDIKCNFFLFTNVCLNSCHAKKKITNFNKFLPTEFLSTNAQNDNAFQQKKGNRRLSKFVIIDHESNMLNKTKMNLRLLAKILCE